MDRFGLPTNARRTAVALFCTALIATAFVAVGPPSASAAGDVPDGFVVATLTDQLSAPTAIEFAPDGRLFIAEQSGTIRIYADGELLATPFLALPVHYAGESGLQSIAFDPAFDTTGFIYVSYTTQALNRRISRFVATANTAEVADEEIIFEIGDEGVSSGVHESTALQFGTDAKLYVAVGDNGNSKFAQDLNSLFGKILRLNRDGSIPADNPFPYAAGDARAVWAYGLRNPFKLALDKDSGAIYINDVGLASYEEVNKAEPGANYGWPLAEGPGGSADLERPQFSSHHAIGSPTGCAVTGGTFYPEADAAFPSAYAGTYFFSDLCDGWIRTLGADGTSAPFATGISGGIVDLSAGPDSKLYFITHYAPSLGRISYETEDPPSVESHPDDQLVSVGEDAVFSAGIEGATPIDRQWQRDGVDIPDATGLSHTIESASLADNGAQFRVVATNEFGTTTSQSATLQVTTSRRPSIEIEAPASGTTYRGGDTISFSGAASDPEDGPLPPESYTWRVDLYHRPHDGHEHSHPVVAPTTGATSGSFEVPRDGHTETDVWFRVQLTVHDSDGLASSAYTDVHPEIANLTFDTVPSGLNIALDGTPQTTPFTVPSVVGVNRTVGVTTPQLFDGAPHHFEAWADSGERDRVITPGPGSHTYVAEFARQAGDSVGFSVAGSRPYAVTGVLTDGDLTVRKDTMGRLFAVSGSGTVLGSHGGNVEISVSARRFLPFIQLFNGYVRLRDPQADRQYSGSLIFSRFWAGATPGTAIGSSAIFDFSRFPWRVYVVEIRVTDTV